MILDNANLDSLNEFLTLIIEDLAKEEAYNCCKLNKN